MKTVLVIGGYGFVGSAVTKLLARTGEYKVTVFDNLMSGAQPIIDNVSFIQGDIRDAIALESNIPYYDTVIHLAAIVGAPACAIDPQLSYEVNVVGTQNVLRAMKRHQLLVYASTSSVYGTVPSNVIVTEDFVPTPVNVYGEHKLITEHMIRTTEGIRPVIVRPVTAFGVTERIRLDLLVNTLIYEALTTGSIRLFEPDIIRPMISVHDFARAIVAAVEGTLLPFETYNLGDERLTVTKRKLAEEIAFLCAATITEIEETSLDPRNYFIDFSKLHATGFRCQGEGLKEAILEIAPHLNRLKQNPSAFSTPALVSEFIKREYV